MKKPSQLFISSLHFLAVFFVSLFFFTSTAVAQAQECTYTLSYGSTSRSFTTSLNDTKRVRLSEFAIPVETSFNISVDASIPESEDPSCDDTHFQVLGVIESAVMKDTNLGEKAGLGKDIEFNRACGQDLYRGEYTLFISQNDLVEPTINVNSVNLKLRNNGDDLCKVNFELDWDNNYQANRIVGYCDLPLPCSKGGKTGTQMCVGTLQSDGTCGGSGAFVTEGETSCSQCVVCETICYAGCSADEYNLDGTPNPFFATGCVGFTDEDAVDGNGYCEPGEGISGIGYDGRPIKPSEDCLNPGVPFEICNQLADGEAKNKCQSCSTRGGIWTAVGCIQTERDELIGTIVSIAVTMAGGVALLMILSAGFMLTTSQGDPKKTSQAKELVTSAVVGLLFIIFSVTILQFIGISILRIPGFGG